MLIDIKDNSQGEHINDGRVRRKLLLGAILLAMVVLAGKAVFLSVFMFKNQSLKKWAANQHVTKVKLPAYRGEITDRYGDPLAISTPVKTIVINSTLIKPEEKEKIKVLGQRLNVSAKKIQNIVDGTTGLIEITLKRRANPDQVAWAKSMDISGVQFKSEFKRFYPAGEVASHLVGFTNVEDHGQEGLERLYDRSLRGVQGTKLAVKDGKRRVFRDVEYIAQPENGRSLNLSIDKRLQYLAYRELHKTYVEHKANSASLVVLDAKTGEVLAAVNQPGFNPNDRANLDMRHTRNRAMLDNFEPGSTVKPFVVAAALEKRYISEYDVFETHGFTRVGRNLVKDHRNYGPLSVTDVLKKSSNVATSKIALQLPREYMWETYLKLGFGSSAGVGFPGEASGMVQDFQQWSRFEQATLSFGYGMSASLLQLARAYTALADDGVVHSVSLLKRDEDDYSRRLFSKETAVAVRRMLEQVVKKDGTAQLASVDGYRVAGKTGTVKKAIAGGYAEDKYLSLFVGMAPASHPRFVIAVMVDEPSMGEYYGGLVAAPVFSKVMAGALRAYGVAPDQEQTMPILLSGKTDEIG